MNEAIVEKPTDPRPGQRGMSFKGMLGMLVLVIVSALSGFGMTQLIPDHVGQHLKTTRWLYYTIIFGLPLLCFVVVFVHEAGHAVGGWLVGFTFNSLIVGPLKIEKKASEGLRLSWNRSLNLAGGLTLSLPQDNKRLRQRFLIYVAAGPIASLLLTMVCLILASAIASSPWSIVVGAGGMMSFLIFMVTIIPLSTGGFATDGRRILNLLSPTRSVGDVAMLSGIAHLQGGRRPRNLPVDIFQKALEHNPPRDMNFITLLTLCYYHACDTGDREAAKAHLDEIVQNGDCYPDGLRDSLWVLPAFDAAFYERNLEDAKSYWDRYQPSTYCDKADVHRYQAAAAVLESNESAAREEISAAREKLGEVMSPGMVPLLQDELDELERRIQSNSMSSDEN